MSRDREMGKERERGREMDIGRGTKTERVERLS